MKNNCHECYIFCNETCENCGQYVCDKHAYHEDPIPWLNDGAVFPALLCEDCHKDESDAMYDPIKWRARQEDLQFSRKYLRNFYEEIPPY